MPELAVERDLGFLKQLEATKLLHRSPTLTSNYVFRSQEPVRKPISTSNLTSQSQELVFAS
jgi:hypothetical protein